MKSYKNEVLKKKDEMVKDLQAWIAQKGVYDPNTIKDGAPFGHDVANSLKWIEEKAKSDGFNVKNHEGYCVEITYGEGKECVMVLAHADVVPEGKGWTYPPYGGEVHNGLIYGRGASDDKGPALASYYALKILKEQNVKLKRQIKIVIGGNEESGSKCLKYYFKEKKHPAPTYGFTPDADFPLIYGEKGIMTYVYEGEFSDNLIASFEAGLAANAVPSECEMVLKRELHLQKAFTEWMRRHNFKGEYEEKEGKTYLKFHGKASHGAFPEGGINAFTMLLYWVGKYTNSDFAKHFGTALSCYYGRRIGIAYYGEPMGPLTMNVGIARYDGQKYQLVINIRYPNNITGSMVAKVLDRSIMHRGSLVSDSKPLYMDPKSPFIKTLLKVYQEETGDYKQKPMTIGGGTYARETTNTVAYGMNFHRNNGTGNIHSPDEALNIEDLVDGASIYARALEELCNL